MASTPTPTPLSLSSVPPRPSTTNNNQRHHRHHNNNNNNNFRNRRQNRNDRCSSSARYDYSSNPSPVPSFTSFFPARRPRLAPEFSGRRSTRHLAKMHSGAPRVVPNNHIHSKAAEDALRSLRLAGNDGLAIDRVLCNYQHKLHGVEDYVYMLKDYANTGDLLLATRTYDFAMNRATENNVRGKLTSNMIRTLGRLRKIDLALNLFDESMRAGFGNTVYTFSAVISALGKNNRFPEAVSLFRNMGKFGLHPNLVTYNAIIDGAAKGEVDFDLVVKFFEEMKASAGCQPDRITYNSLLATCVPRARWQLAQDLIAEMDHKGIQQDVYTYNTYLDALCKAGRMDIARWVLDVEMPSKNICPNVVTYSTMMDGYAKANSLEDALNIYDEMKHMSIRLDRVSYNTLIGVYAKLGWFEEAMITCEEMESCGIKSDVVTYNALIVGYGKNGKYVEVRRVFAEMKARHVRPNELTYSTMINVYTKSGMYAEVMDVYREFKEEGMKVDVVFYSALIDALCKNGLVDSSMGLLDAMIKKGIRPNVVTYNSIIDAFQPGEVSALEWRADTTCQANEYQIESSSRLIVGAFQNQNSHENDEIMKMFEQLAGEKAGHTRKDMRGRQDNFSILLLFRRMHAMEIRPNVVTFSAILNACSRCHSFIDASKLLGGLQPFDSQVYGVAHGLLMGYGDHTWKWARSLFDEIKQMDSSTASAFFNALTDMLWHFGQKLGAKTVVLEGRERNVWKGHWSDSCVDLHLMSCGAACAMVHSWLHDIHSIVFRGNDPPNVLSILTGWGKHSKVIGDGILRKAIEALLKDMGAPFEIAECNLGRFISQGPVLAAWLRQPSTCHVLVLRDRIVNSQIVDPQPADRMFELPPLCL